MTKLNNCNGSKTIDDPKRVHKKKFKHEDTTTLTLKSGAQQTSQSNHSTQLDLLEDYARMGGNLNMKSITTML